ncbi:hypothetical protein [Corynebacterium sp.]|uniref:hypothetical protein n=1 Tax=Corynebacterium sp. TaxID=1720 RepID=UPI0028AF8E50|nr:hypothetical protein [Corynebacterium sp.]
MTTINYTTFSPLEIDIMRGGMPFMTRTHFGENTGVPAIEITSKSDFDYSGELLTIAQVEELITMLQHARDEALEYTEPIPYTLA